MLTTDHLVDFFQDGGFLFSRCLLITAMLPEQGQAVSQRQDLKTQTRTLLNWQKLRLKLTLILTLKIT